MSEVRRETWRGVLDTLLSSTWHQHSDDITQAEAAMKRNRYHPPLPPSEAQHVADSYGPTGITSEAIDAVFRCHHGVDKCDSRCPDCDAEYHAMVCEDPHCACQDARRELKAVERYDEWKDELL